MESTSTVEKLKMHLGNAWKVFEFDFGEGVGTLNREKKYILIRFYAHIHVVNYNSC